MPFLIVIIVAIFAVVLVAYPFFRRGDPRRELLHSPSSVAGERGRREEMYQEIRALQMEFHLGTLEESEYRRQVQFCRMEAARSIRDEELSLLDMELEERIFSSRVSAIGKDSPDILTSEDGGSSPTHSTEDKEDDGKVEP